MMPGLLVDRAARSWAHSIPSGISTAVSGIFDVARPVEIRHCADCGHPLAQMNSDDCCYVCQRKRDAAKWDQRVEADRRGAEAKLKYQRKYARRKRESLELQVEGGAR